MRASDASRFHRLLLLVPAFLLIASTSPPLSSPADGDRPRSIRSVSTDRGNVVDGVIVVKLRESAAKNDDGLAKLMRVHGGAEMEKLFPFLDARPRKRPSPLQRIYTITYTSGENPWTVAEKFARNPAVEYAEPLPVFRTTGPDDVLTPLTPAEAAALRATASSLDPLDTPNDPRLPSLTYLNQIQALEAWDVVKAEQGDVVVAVVDGGTDWQHPDLIGNIWTNPGEVPDNGRDDDNNGFIDDVHGWNFLNGTGDPTGSPSTPSNAQHGTAVAGVLAAVTNNEDGIASVSWNPRFMAINAGGSEDNQIPGSFGYGGIVYAAENGADIINASWGGIGSPLRTLQEVINEVTALGALVVSSAGNGGDDSIGDNNDIIRNYPPGYDNVLAVGATFETNDRKVTFSNYGVSVDIFAPGRRIFTTFPDNSYGTLGGTSFSSPITAAVAALVKTRFPEMTPEEVREQLRATADPIDDDNPTFTGLLGQGRVNALRAVTETDHSGIRLVGYSITDPGGDGFAESGETVTITARFTNYLADAANVALSLLIDDPNLTVLDGQATLPALNRGDTLDVDFSVEVGADTPSQYAFLFTVEAAAGEDVSRDLLRLTANPPAFLTHDTGRIKTSITNEGNIGWIDTQSPLDGSPAFGTGFVFANRDLLFEGGLLLANSPGRVSDTVRGSEIDQERDFEPDGAIALQINTPGELAHEEGRISFADTRAALPLGISVIQETYADTSDALDEVVVIKYTFTNETSATIEDLHAGLFFDWDVNVDALDYSRFDRDRRLGWVGNAASFSLAAGTQVLSTNAPASYQAIDLRNEVEEPGVFFSSSLKWQFLSGGLQRETADNIDIAQLIGTGPFSLLPGCTADIGFALHAAQRESDMQASADAAQAFWDNELQLLRPGNQPPAITRALPDTSITEGQALTFAFSGSDPNPCDAPTYRLVEAPATASIQPNTGLFSFTPGFDESGNFPLTVVLSDGLTADTARATITVLEANRPPAFTQALPDTNVGVPVGATFSFSFSGFDPDNDALTYSLIDPPANTSIDPATGLFTFTPAPDQTGTHVVDVVVSDGLLSATYRLTLTVVIPELVLAAGYPNPFTRSTTIELQIPEPGPATLHIYDITGRLVRTLLDRTLEIGLHTVTWDGAMQSGSPAAGGVYLGRLTATKGTDTATRNIKLVLVR